MSSVLTSSPILLLLWVAGCAGGHQRAPSRLGAIVTVREAYANVHVIPTDGGLVLVDAGYEQSAPDLVARLRDAGLDPAQVRAVIVTHGHSDHAGGADYLRRELGVTVIAGRRDAEMIAAGRMEALCPTSWFAESRLEEDLAEVYEGYTADVWIDEATDLGPLVGVRGKALPVPGHTPGSLVVVAEDVAFVGDLFRGSIVGAGVETHFYQCDVEATRRDILLLLDAHPKVRTFFTGHFGPVDREAVEAYVAPLRRADPGPRSPRRPRGPTSTGPSPSEAAGR